MLTKEEVEKALAGAPVETEDGKEVTQLTKFYRHTGLPFLIGMLPDTDTAIGRWEMNGGSPLLNWPSLRLKKEKRTVEYTLMVKLDGETIWVESRDIDAWLLSGSRWRKTNQTMTKEIEVE